MCVGGDGGRGARVIEWVLNVWVGGWVLNVWVLNVWVGGWYNNNNNNNRRLVTLAEHTSDHGKQTNSGTIEKGEHG